QSADQPAEHRIDAKGHAHELAERVAPGVVTLERAHVEARRGDPERDHRGARERPPRGVRTLGSRSTRNPVDARHRDVLSGIRRTIGRSAEMAARRAVRQTVANAASRSLRSLARMVTRGAPSGSRTGHYPGRKAENPWGSRWHGRCLRRAHPDLSQGEK